MGYRDLKPENLLITQAGYLKLTDMGLAKVLIGKTFTMCGTPDYMAPEIIASTGHNRAVDWWTLGILIFELLVGRPPFEAQTVMQTYQKIRTGIKIVKFPKKKIKGDAKALVESLCQNDPSERIAMKGGAEKIRCHDYFKENGVAYRWNALHSQELDVPYLPEVKSKTDMANFSASQEDMPPQVKY